MLDKHMRHVKEDVLAPATRWLGSELRLSPTQITLLGGAVGLVSAAVAWQGWYLLGLVFWIVNRILDGLDGAVARMFKKQSDLGGYIDIMVDDVIYAVIPIAIALSIGQASVYIALIFMLATFYVNMASWTVLSSILEKRNRGANKSGEMTTVTMPPGLIEGTETVAFYSLFFLLPNFTAALFIIMGILVIITIAQRMQWALNNID